MPQQLIPARIRSELLRYRRASSPLALTLEMGRALTWSRKAVEADLDRTYREAEDPWNYASTAEEVRKYDACVDMIRDPSVNDRPRTLEVGCAEGLFTQRLAPLCGSLLAVDVSAVALARTEARCSAHTNVQFARWRLPSGPPLGVFDLVVCTDTLLYVAPFRRPRAVVKLAQMVMPGGHLIVSEYLRDPVIEQSTWGPLLLSGATHLVDRFGSSVGMTLVRKELTGAHVVALYRQTRRPE